MLSANHKPVVRISICSTSQRAFALRQGISSRAITKAMPESSTSSGSCPTIAHVPVHTACHKRLTSSSDNGEVLVTALLAADRFRKRLMKYGNHNTPTRICPANHTSSTEYRVPSAERE